MASLRADKGRLFIDFIYRGHRCRESLHLADNRENRIVACQLIRRIEAELALGTFDYAATFPHRRKAEKSSESRKRGVQNLGEFARNWLESRRPSLKPATFYDYSKLLSLTSYHQNRRRCC
jgi:integrase